MDGTTSSCSYVVNLTNRKSSRRSIQIIFTLKLLYISLTLITSIVHQLFGVTLQETTMEYFKSKSKWDTIWHRLTPSQINRGLKCIQRLASPDI